MAEATGKSATEQYAEMMAAIRKMENQAEALRLKARQEIVDDVRAKCKEYEITNAELKGFLTIKRPKKADAEKNA